MNAPDKVFVYCDHEGNPDKVDIYPLGKNSIEYIRKDALLEWAEDFKATTGWSEIQEAMDDLIDKLNSM